MAEKSFLSFPLSSRVNKGSPGFHTFVCREGGSDPSVEFSTHFFDGFPKMFFFRVLRMSENRQRQYLRIKSPAELEGEVRQEPGLKRRRSAASLHVLCPVCGGPAPDHVHFGGKTELSQSESDSGIIFHLLGQCCYSCRAFFRRSSSRPVSSFRCR